MFYHNINPTLFEFGPFEIRYYGIIFVLGFVLTYFFLIFLSKEKQLNLSRDDISGLVLYGIIGVVLFARIFYIIFYNLSFYMANPIQVFALWNGGLSFHGGFIGAVIAIFYFSKKKKIPFYDLLDIIAIPTSLGLMLGRIGNFLNGELWGRVTNMSFCVDYSSSQYIRSPPEGCRHFSQIYESLKNLLIFGVLWNIRKLNLPKGFLFWTFVSLYASFRFIVEFFREPDAQLGFIFFNLTMGQILSLLMFIIGVYFLSSLKRFKKA